jgi:hypothetical protein
MIPRPAWADVVRLCMPDGARIERPLLVVEEVAVQRGDELLVGLEEPPVARYDWREGMAAAQLRRPPGFTDRAPYDDQAIDALTALHGYTTQPALTLAAGTGSAVSRRASWPTSPSSRRTRSMSRPTTSC